MKILIVTQYFWPENFRINDLAIGLRERGHYVEVLTGKPNYPKGKFYDKYSFLSPSTEIWNNIVVHRAPLFARGKSGGIRLMLNYLSFAFFSSMRALRIKGEFDKILVYEPSPITVGIPAAVLKWQKKAQVYFWVQDLWPQSVRAAGNINNKFLMKGLDKVTRWVYKTSDKILIQSQAFRTVIEGQGVNKDKLIYHPNSVEDIFQITEPDNEILSLLPVGFKVMFAGNIGEAQDFETIVEAARLVKVINPYIKWIILGDGRKKSYVEEKIVEFGLQEQIYLMGSYPVEKMPAFFACADCLLVSLKREEIFSLTVPSKIQSYLACGKPILASLDGEGGRIIKDANAGFVVNAESPEQLAICVSGLINMERSDLSRLGQNGRKYFEANFERELLIDRLEEIFKIHD